MGQCRSHSVRDGPDLMLGLSRLKEKKCRVYKFSSHIFYGLYMHACRCEVRSGPEFLLRKYVFYASGRFHLVQFYYADAQCRDPAFSVEARGVYQQLYPSWTVRGGTEVDYETTHVAVVAYTDAVATALQRTVNSTCNIGAFRKSIEHIKVRKLYMTPQYTENPTTAPGVYHCPKRCLRPSPESVVQEHADSSQANKIKVICRQNLEIQTRN